MNTPSMKESTTGRVITGLYARLPSRGKALAIATRLEGGQMTSLSLRRILADHHGVTVGNHSYGSLLVPGYADRGTTIGAYVSIGPGVRRFGAAHPLDDPCLHPYWYNPRLGLVGEENDVARTECWIGHGAWIGANSLILPGCTRIGIGAVVGAGSVVTHDVPDFAVVAGNPARELRLRLTQSKRDAILDARHWEHDPPEAHTILEQIRGDRP